MDIRTESSTMESGNQLRFLTGNEHIQARLMELEGTALFKIKTPLNVEAGISEKYWEYLITIKHRFMKGKEDIVKDTLQCPDQIRQSRTDKDVFLYYKHFERLYCVVVKHTGTEGFVITAYPADKVKEGDAVWTK